MWFTQQVHNEQLTFCIWIRILLTKLLMCLLWLSFIFVIAAWWDWMINKTAEAETTPQPCIGLCHEEKKKNLPEDNDLTKIKDSRKKGQRCVGLCYLRKKNGIASDPHLEKLHKGDHVLGFVIFWRRRWKILKKLKNE